MDPVEQRPALPPGWLPPGGSQPAGPAPAAPRQGIRRVTGPLLAALAAVAKFGKAALLVLPKLKLLTTSGSMLVSVAAYSLIWGWTFALGFVALLFVHEMGHVIQLRREGIQASAPLFIPFLGAVVGAKSLGEDAAAEARVGLAGPVLGTAGAAVVLGVYGLTGNTFWEALAFTGFFLNLFNLLPVTPLDGGRAMAALTPWMWFVGLFLFAVLTFTVPNPVLILFLVLAGLDVYRRWKGYRHGDRSYYRVTRHQRALVLAVYLGLIVLLAVGMDATHVARDLHDV